MKFDIRNKDKNEINKILSDAWLNIIVDESTLFNPLMNIPEECREKEHLYILWLMSQPEYFSFLCKEILNIDTPPFQNVILSELYGRKFPMLVGSRGLGKAEPITNSILTDKGWVKMGDIKIGTKIYGRDGFLHNVTNIYPQGKKRICRLKFADGRTIDCCEDHLWVVKKGSHKEKVFSTKEIIESGVIWQSSLKKYAYKYKVPHCNPIQFDKKELIIDPYILGCLLGDGTMNSKTPKIATNDLFIIDQFKNKLEDFEIKQDKTNNNYTLVDKNKEYTKIIRGNQEYLSRNKNRLTDKIEKLKLSVSCKYKFIPDNYKYSSIEDRMELVRGLLDTDGSINTDGSIEFTNTCEKLVDDLIEVLRSLGISCIKSNDNRVGETFINPTGKECLRGFYYRVYINTSKEVFKLPRKLEKLKNKSTGRELYNAIISAEYIDDFVEMQCISVDSPDNTYITKDYIVTHNTFILAVYSIIRCLTIPNRQVVIAGAGFRQSKLLFDYIVRIWNNAPLLRDWVGGVNNNGPKFGTDTYKFTLGDSTILAIPIGDGRTIRGIRANDLIIDEFHSHSEEIFENVLSGFAAVSQKPIDKIQLEAAKNFAKKFNIKMEEASIMEEKSNQIILSGTAYYHFNHFFKYWSNWKNYIKSKGDPEKLKAIFGDKVPDGFDHNHYSIMRIPASFLPDGYMDKGNLARSKATLHKSLYGMEFEACGDANVPIITKKGIKRIVDVKVGEEVLTHKGRFRKVIKKTVRPYNGKIVKYKTFNYYKDIYFTPDHPFFINGDFKRLDSIEYTNYCPIKELSNIKEIDITNYVTNYVNKNDFIYPKSSQNKIPEETKNEILKLYKEGFSKTEISKKTNIKFCNVFSIIKNKDLKPKGSIEKIIKLDYNLGLIFGYYASEGSCGKNNVYFSLDSHKDIKLENYINELENAIDNSIKIKTKKYNYKKDKCASLCVNSRIFKEIIKNICPGICYDKLIKHDILFSNEDFMKGFIVGMFNGDGHIRENLATVCLTNKNLINQIKMVLEYFGICSSFFKPKLIKEKIIKSKKTCLSQKYKLDITGIYLEKFLDIFYNKKINNSNKKLENRKTEIIEDVIKYTIKDMDFVDYDDYVYNLEVEEDHTYSLPNATVHNCFSEDSEGFFKATLINSCVSNVKNGISKEGYDIIQFDPRLHGDPNLQYVMAVDPASENDNFAITMIEVHPNHRRIVYCWTTNSKDFKEKRSKGEIEETDFYGYCARHIRNLMKKFNVCRIAIDSQGGGKAVYEALHDKNRLEPGEILIWETIEEKQKDSDGEDGLHIVELVNFAKSEYTSESNHGMKKDFEDKILLFPNYNPAILALFTEEMKEEGFSSGSIAIQMEDCLIEIEELKKELSQIIVTTTATGRERWDTPDVKISGAEKGKMRKDRYSSLLMCNMSARKMFFSKEINHDLSVGGFAHMYLSSKKEEKKTNFTGPAWAVNKLNDLY